MIVLLIEDKKVDLFIYDRKERVIILLSNVFLP